MKVLAVTISQGLEVATKTRQQKIDLKQQGIANSTHEPEPDERHAQATALSNQ